MKDVIVIIAVTAVMIGGFFIMKRLNAFLEANAKKLLTNRKGASIIITIILVYVREPKETVFLPVLHKDDSEISFHGRIGRG